jgi:hypothetical protein
MLTNLVKRVALYASEVQKSAVKSTASGSTITQYKEGQLVNRTALTLKKEEDIEAYVVKTVQNYFRTTYKNGKLPSTQASPRTALLPNMDLIPWTQSKSQCRSSKILATPSPQRPYPPSPRSSTTSPTSSTSRPSRKRITKPPSDDQLTLICTTPQLLQASIGSICICGI